ncbi:MAG: hypothetical protein MUE44_20425 [Oscillatoriaceae cyanobacterium Prado104]|nr:hypothetical protein [Oscillatoriaceae cyanobacterium Prado104]
MKTEEGRTIDSSTIVLINLENAPKFNSLPPSQELNLTGFRPRWLP